jgi:hypothetical protein
LQFSASVSRPSLACKSLADILRNQSTMTKVAVELNKKSAVSLQRLMRYSALPLRRIPPKLLNVCKGSWIRTNDQDGLFIYFRKLNFSFSNVQS